MSYKTNIKNKILLCLKEKDCDLEMIVSRVIDEFKYVLYISKTAGISLKYITFSFLEGLDEALVETRKDKEQIIQAVSSAIAEVVHETSKVNIKKIKLSQLNHTHKREKIESERAQLEDIVEGFKEYILEKGYHILSQSVRKAQHIADSINDDLNHREL